MTKLCKQRDENVNLQFTECFLSAIFHRYVIRMSLEVTGGEIYTASIQKRSYKCSL